MKHLSIYKIAALVLLLSFILPFSAFAIEFCDVQGTENIIKVPCFQKGGGGPPGPANASTFGSLVVFVLQTALGVVGAIAVIFIVIGGFRYVTAHGNEEAAEAAKKTLTHALLGLAIVILAFAAVAIISNMLYTGSPAAHP